MIFNIDYLMQHISYELHTIVKNWTDNLSSQTKPEVVCARKDISDEYLPFSVFTDSILNAEDTFNLANSPLIFSVGTADQQIFYAYIATGEKYLLIGPVMFSSFIQIACLLSMNLRPVARCSFSFSCVSRPGKFQRTCVTRLIQFSISSGTP